MLPDTTITRPALRYYGGKWNLAPWIISHFPAHKNYVEPCGGAASVLLQKPRSPLETYNDLDGNVVNFFRVLRDRPEELIRKIRLTPWARSEYETSLTPASDEVEQARRYFVMLWMSMNGGSHDTATGTWRILKHIDGRPGGIASDLNSDHLEEIARRFVNVQIENKPATDVIQRFDNSDALIYFDPPYITATRAQAERYAFEWTDVQHIEAASLLRDCAGNAVVSGYACPLYTELYEAHGWSRVDKEAQTNSGGKRIESLWLSPRTVEALNAPRQASLFGA
jgi:DNA adenine methylase